MSGNEESNEDFVLGRWNRAQDMTLLAADVRPDGEHPFRFLGEAVFVAKVTNSAYDIDAYTHEDGSVNDPYQPGAPVDGIVGQGWSGPEGFDRRGTGVTGIGGFREGTGVHGLGGGNRNIDGRVGKGGIGVHGVGGSVETTFRQREMPGAGVVGQGGLVRDLSGDTYESAPSVIGIGGKIEKPQFDSIDDAGVVGLSRDGRGGVFSTETGSQVTVVPRPHELFFDEFQEHLPKLVTTDRRNVLLPKQGRAGDICCLADEVGRACLWFCTHSQKDSSTPAQWAQILLGPAIVGST